MELSEDFNFEEEGKVVLSLDFDELHKACQDEGLPVADAPEQMQQALLVHFGHLEPAADAQAQNEYESYLSVISKLTVEEAHQICAEEEVVVRPSTLCRSIHVRGTSSGLA